MKIKYFLATAIPVIAIAIIFLFIQKNRIYGCYPEHLQQKTLFDRTAWTNGEQRESYVVIIKKLLFRKNKTDVVELLGAPNKIHSTENLSMRYFLGKLRLFSCKFNTSAFLVVEFDDTGHVKEINTYTD